MKKTHLLAVAFATTFATNQASAQWTRTGTNTNLTNAADRVGIGTTVPAAKVDITGNSTATLPQLRLYEPENDAARLSFQNANTTRSWLLSGFTSTQTPDLFRVTHSTAGTMATFTNQGRMGLGTETPEADIHIKKSNSAYLMLETVGVPATCNAALRLYNRYETSPLIAGRIPAGWEINMTSNTLNFRHSSFSFANYTMTTNTFLAGSDNTYLLGSSLNRWKLVYSANGIATTSDAREKTNIKPLSYGIKEIMQLRPVSYNWIKNPEQGTRIGLIAQELKEVVSEVVTQGDLDNREKKTEDMRYGVLYSELIPVLINAIKEQQVQIQLQNTQIDDLKKVVAQLASEKQAQIQDPEGKLMISPNPANGKVTFSISLPLGEKGKIVVSDMMGTALKTISCKTGQEQVSVNIADMKAGTYVVSLVSGEKVLRAERLAVQ